MAIGGVLGNGTKVGYSMTSPVSYIKVAQLQDVPTFINLVAADISTTVHSTSNVETLMPGLVAPPEIQLKVLLDLDEATTPTHAAMINFQATGVTLWWRVEVPVDRLQSRFKAWEFQAYVKTFNITTVIGAAQTGVIALKYGGGLSRYNAGASVLG